jgi:hypothetical protein
MKALLPEPSLADLCGSSEHPEFSSPAPPGLLRSLARLADALTPVSDVNALPDD